MIQEVSRRYETSRDSGVEWIGDIPEHWGIKRIKEVSIINRKSLSEQTHNDYEFDYVDINSVTYGERRYSTERLIFGEAPSRARRIVKKGDTLISTVRTYLKAVSHIENNAKDLIASTGFAVITPKQSVYEKYQSYLLTADFIIDEICAISTGVSYPAINATTIGNLFFLLPPFSEQKAIADYLDTKTAKIDQKVDLLAQKAKHYGQLKQSLINEAVTRGLDKTVPMKDSGIEWIGGIPEHWNIRHFKQFSTMKGRIGWQGLKHSEFIDDGPFLITGMNFQKGKIVWDEVYHITNERYEQAPEIQLKDGDVLMTKDGTIGKLLFVEDIPAPHKASLNSHLLVFRPMRNSYYPKYLYYQLDSSVFQSYVEIAKTGTTFFGISQAAVGKYIGVLPPLPEQRVIADYLDIKTVQIDTIVKTVNTQIAALKELRKTLINDVVIGKIKVV